MELRVLRGFKDRDVGFLKRGIFVLTKKGGNPQNEEVTAVG